ncbi:MAG: dTDP-3-amino-3,4,6-trideoxy-alpha-D-glucose transaminase [Fimbriimonadaceae bacterium]|nr:dTDP-3-amino-3,4,6-trideoxy-alpha-D-glucose transaminase [Fimbriimonadaceae bacterium]
MVTPPPASLRNVPYFNYPAAFSRDEAAYVEIFREIMARGAFIQQRELEEFEAALKQYLGVHTVFGVGNATDGLIMCWKAAGLKLGDEVLFPSHTMVASPASVAHSNGTPVPVDMGEDGLIDPDAVEAAITPRTVAILPVHLNGRTCQMDRLQAIADRHGLFIVEDAAQALGSKYKGKMAGTFGVGSSISFYPAKILGCMGDGGAVATNSPEIAERFHLLRDHGRGSDGEVHAWGLNSRLDNLQAAILMHQFRHYGDIVSRRRSIARHYHGRLSDLEELRLPPPPDADQDHFDVFQNYELQADRRDELREHLKLNGVGTLIQWGGKAVHQWADLGLRGELPRTERFFSRCLMLPMNMMIDDDDVDYVCDQVRSFYRG